MNRYYLVFANGVNTPMCEGEFIEFMAINEYEYAIEINQDFYWDLIAADQDEDGSYEEVMAEIAEELELAQATCDQLNADDFSDEDHAAHMADEVHASVTEFTDF